MFSIMKAQLIKEQHITSFQAEIMFLKILVAQHRIVNLKESVLAVRVFSYYFRIHLTSLSSNKPAHRIPFRCEKILHSSHCSFVPT